MKTILIPVDFSINSTHASHYAGMLAKKLNAKVVLLNVYSIPMLSEYQQPYDSEKIMVQCKENAEQELQSFTDKFIKTSNLTAEQVSQAVEYGFVPETISETAKSVNADMIVMGTRGADNALDKWLGTNAQKVMNMSECPVWIVPENASLNFPLTIMYAADFKNNEEITTSRVIDMATHLGATCNVVHIHDYFQLTIGTTDKEIAKSLTDKFEYDDVSFQNLNHKDVIEGLERYIKNHTPDVLALAVYEKSFLGKVFDSSITQHFVQGATLPMLVFRK